MSGEMESDDILEIKEKELKNLYEKFCFLNHLTELRLSDEEVIKSLEKNYGY